jgi:ribosome maturation factor RimP
VEGISTEGYAGHRATPATAGTAARRQQSFFLQGLIPLPDGGADSDQVSRSLAQNELKKRLVELLEPVVRGQGAAVVDLELVGAGSNQTLRLLIHKETGVTVGLCEAISREVSDLLDIEDPITGRYRLEVTSPGLDRPLRTDEDFTRAAGRRLKIVLTSGRTVFGRLLDWDSANLQLEGKSGQSPVPRQEIAKATIEAEL